MQSPDNILTDRQKDFCGYGGAFGCLITLTCLVQHIMITRAHWITYFLTFAYLFLILAFLFLALQKSFAPILLIIGSVFSLAAEYIFISNFVFSLIVVVLLIYTTIMVILVYMDQLHVLLKQKAIAQKAEENEWKRKIG